MSKKYFGLKIESIAVNEMLRYIDQERALSVKEFRVITPEESRDKFSIYARDCKVLEIAKHLLRSRGYIVKA